MLFLYHDLPLLSVVSPKRDESKRRYNLADPTRVRKQAPVRVIPLWTDPGNAQNCVRLREQHPETQTTGSVVEQTLPTEDSSSEGSPIPAPVKRKQPVKPSNVALPKKSKAPKNAVVTATKKRVKKKAPKKKPKKQKASKTMSKQPSATSKSQASVKSANLQGNLLLSP